MGCGAGKEAEEPRREPEEVNDDAPPQQLPDPDDGRPPVTLEQLSELWTAGISDYGTPPHYIDIAAGPWCTLERVPAQTNQINKFVISRSGEVPRIIHDVSDTDTAGPTDDANTPIDLSEASGIYARAFLPHSLTGFCVGWARPDWPASRLVADFQYSAEEDGAKDLEAAQKRKPAKRDVSSRRRVLLFPKHLDAVGLFVRVSGGESFTSRVVAPLTSDCDASNTEPIDGAFATYSLVQPVAPHELTPSPAHPRVIRHEPNAEIGRGTVAQSPVTYRENSLSMTLLRVGLSAPPAGPSTVQRRLADETPMRGGGLQRGTDELEASFARRLLKLEDGRHEIELSLRFRYETGELTAVYERPAPTPGTSATRVVGTYRTQSDSSSSSNLSATIATGSFAVYMNSKVRARLSDLVERS